MINGDEPESGSNLGIALELTIKQCANKCHEKDECKSFEHNKFLMLCNLNDISNASHKLFKNSTICKKIGSLLNITR